MFLYASKQITVLILREGMRQMTSNTDFLPPEEPGVHKKQGFFSKLFGKKENDNNELELSLPDLDKAINELPKIHVSHKIKEESFIDNKDDDSDISEIRKKLGLDVEEELPKAPVKVLTKKEVKKPTPKKIIHSQIKKEIPKKQLDLPKINEEFDEEIKIKSKADEHVKKELNKIKKEAKKILDHTKDGAFGKKTKVLNNEFIIPNKVHLKTIKDLKKVISSKEKYHRFKGVIANNMQSFSVWLNRNLKQQEEREEFLKKEIYKKISNLNEDYLKKVDSVIAKYHPIKRELLNKVMKQEAQIKREYTQLKESQKKLKTWETKLTSEQEELDKRTIVLQKKEKERENFYNKKFEGFDKWMNEQKTKFEQEKKEYETRENRLKEELVRANRIAYELKIKNQDEKKQIHPAYLQMKKEQKQFEEKKAIIEQRLKEHETRLIEKINYNENLLTSIAKEKQKLDQIKAQVEQGGFSNYLNHKLANVPEDDYSLPNEGMKEVVAPNMNVVNEIKDLVNACKASLDSGDLINARDTYNHLRQKFLNKKFSEAQRTDLYREIRELYDDINLKILERQALNHL